MLAKMIISMLETGLRHSSGRYKIKRSLIELIDLKFVVILIIEISGTVMI